MRPTVGLMLAGLAMVGLYMLAGSTRRHEAERRQPRARRSPARIWPPASQREGTGSGNGWDEVDEASYQSFPASDPPAYYRTRR